MLNAQRRGFRPPGFAGGGPDPLPPPMRAGFSVSPGGGGARWGGAIFGLGADNGLKKFFGAFSAWEGTRQGFPYVRARDGSKRSVIFRDFP